MAKRRVKQVAKPSDVVPRLRKALLKRTKAELVEILVELAQGDRTLLRRLIGLGELRLAMELSLELMKQGSYQVEMSDEGLMTEDIEECLQVVVTSLQKCVLPPGEIVAWCKAMTKTDRVGFIYDRELAALRKHAEASGA